jgi:hypothetical protein
MMYTRSSVCLQSKSECGSSANYVPTPRKRPNTAEISELEAAADRLASALADADEEEIVAEFKQLRRGKRSSR